MKEASRRSWAPSAPYLIVPHHICRSTSYLIASERIWSDRIRSHRPRPAAGERHHHHRAADPGGARHRPAPARGGAAQGRRRQGRQGAPTAPVSRLSVVEPIAFRVLVISRRKWTILCTLHAHGVEPAARPEQRAARSAQRASCAARDRCTLTPKPVTLSPPAAPLKCVQAATERADALRDAMASAHAKARFAVRSLFLPDRFLSAPLSAPCSFPSASYPLRCPLPVRSRPLPIHSLSAP